MAIKLSIITAFDDKELKRAQREIAAVGKSISRSLNLAVGAATIGAVAGLTDAVKAASNYAAEFEGVNQIFKEAAGTVQAFAKTAAASAGMSETMALRAAKSFGGFATAAGLSGQAAAGFSTNLVQAAADLGSFFDVPVEDALAAIKSGLAGETEPLKKFNILLNDSSLRAEAMAMQLTKTTKEALTPQQKVLAANSLILKGLGAAQGDFVNYQDTFGNAIKTITAEFEDMQRQIGEQLLPILESILPAVRELIPVLGEKLKAAVASVDWKAFFEGIVTSISFLIENGKQIAILIGTLFALNKAFAAIKIGIDVTNLSMALLNGTIAINPFAVVIGSIAVMTAGLIGLGIAAFQADNAVANMNSTYYGRGSSRAAGPQAAAAAKGAAGYASRYAGMEAMGAALGLGGGAAGNSAQALKDQLAAIAAAASGGVSASEAKKAASAAAKAAKAKAKAIADALAESLKLAKQQISDQNDTIQREFEATQKLFDDQTKAIQDFKTDLGDVNKQLTNLTMSEMDLGKFAQDVTNTFEDIDKAITSNSKTFTDGGEALKAYAATEKVLILDIAKQRDKLAEKYSLAKAVKSDIESAIKSFGNITNLLDKQSTQVTETMTSVVDGIQLTRSKLVEQTTTGNIVANFQAILDKTKAFATSLKKLRALGLDQNLYKQIVDAGVDAGGQTAEAILAGGSDTVASLNTIFKDLNSVGADIGEQTAQVMYGAGVDLTNGLLEGIKSKDQELVDQANALAELFAKTFNDKVAALVIKPVTPTSSTLSSQYPGFTDYINGALSGYSGAALADQIDMLTGANVSAPGSFMNSLGYMKSNGVTVNINANTITDQASLPALVTNALVTASKQGLTGSLSRVLAI